MPDMATRDRGSCTLVTLRPVAQSPELARTFVHHRFLTFGAPQEMIDDGCVIASELVTNVVKHVPWAVTFYMRVTKNGYTPLIEVWDPATAAPVVVKEPDGESGRGLIVVESLATTWYYDILPPQRGGGKIVAALL